MFSWRSKRNNQKKRVKNTIFCIKDVTNDIRGLAVVCETLYAICHHLYSLKNLKNTVGGMLLLVKMQAEACDFTKSNTPAMGVFDVF